MLPKDSYFSVFLNSLFCPYKLVFRGIFSDYCRVENVKFQRVLTRQNHSIVS